MRPILVLALASSLHACATSATCPPAASTPEAASASAGTTSPEANTARAPVSSEVRSAEASPKRAAPSGKAFITLLARGQNAFVGKLEMVPGAQVPEHQDPTEEYIHVLSGHGTLVMDGQRYEIKAGTTIYMPAFATVSYQNSDEPFVGLQVFAGPSPADKYETWKSE